MLVHKLYNLLIEGLNFNFPYSSPDMLRMLEDEVKLAMMLDKQVSKTIANKMTNRSQHNSK